MKVNIISHSDSAGGAARAAYRLHEALSLLNISNKMLVIQKNTSNHNIIEPYNKFYKFYNLGINLISQKIQGLQKNKIPILHSSNFFGSRLYSMIQNSDADIVNLHWINKETLSIKQIAKINKPVVMTLHDMWAFCGTEHLSVDSSLSQFRIGYDETNFDSDYISGINWNKLTWKAKRKHWKKPFIIVTPSRWLSKCAKESILFRNWDVHTIPNALDTDTFKQCDKNVARNLLHLPNKKKLIGFGAMGGGVDPNKGFDLLMEAIALLPNKEEFQCVIFGQNEPLEKIDLKIPLTYLGHLHDEVALTLFYNSIDVMVVPSRQEAFGQTASEAHSCGTPVVAFNSTGLSDVVKHKRTGYLATPFDSADLSSGIEWVLQNSILQSLGINARKRAENLWSYKVVATKYGKLFRKIDK